MTAILTKIVTNPEFSTDELRVIDRGVSLRIGRNTGNWHPDGKPWLASIYADITCYKNRSLWRSGYGSFGSTREDAIQAAYHICRDHSLDFPSDWLTEVQSAIREDDKIND